MGFEPGTSTIGETNPAPPLKNFIADTTLPRFRRNRVSLQLVLREEFSLRGDGQDTLWYDGNLDDRGCRGRGRGRRRMWEQGGCPECCLVGRTWMRRWNEGWVTWRSQLSCRTSQASGSYNSGKVYFFVGLAWH